MKQILVFIFDGYADWEPAYVCAQLNAPGTGYAVKTIGPVSYTHLDVYKRQGPGDAAQGASDACVIHGVTSAG